MRRTALSSALLLVVVSAGPSAAGGDCDPSGPESITAARLKERVYFLASEALEGRYPGSRGFRTAADYAAAQFEAWGLLPPIETGDRAGYLQPVPLLRRTVTEAPQVTVRSASGDRTFGPGHLKLYASEGLTGDGAPLPVAFAGFGIHEPTLGWDDLDNLNIDGASVLMLLGAPSLDGKPVLPESANKAYAPMNSVRRKWLTARRAAAVLVLTDESLREGFESLPDFPEGPRFVLNDREPGCYGSAPLGFLSPELGQALFEGRPLPVPEEVSAGRARPRRLDGVSMIIRTPLADEPITTWNVIGIVEGTDPHLRDQVVVVSAHLDHLPPAPDGDVHPGANDNASGAAAVMEIARVIAARPPARSVAFVLFGAEEGGWSGSRQFLARGPVPRERIVAQVNLDMIGRTEEGLEEHRDQYVLDSSRITAKFTRLIEDVNARTVAWSLRLEHPANLGDSDHYPFDAHGIPAVNFYTGRIPETHQPTDTPDRLDYDKAARLARLACEVALELGRRDPLWEGGSAAR